MTFSQYNYISCVQQATGKIKLKYRHRKKKNHMKLLEMKTSVCDKRQIVREEDRNRKVEGKINELEDVTIESE